MTIFAVLMREPQPGIVEIIKRDFPGNHLEITSTQWLVSSNDNVFEVCGKLGIWHPRHPPQVSAGHAIVLATSAYYGVALPKVWEWMKSKTEGPKNAV